MPCADRISVVIAAYNYGRFLPDAIRSALEQRDVSCEVVVVDDGSTDDTADVLRRHGRDVVVVSQENKGLSAARNAGLARARGRYVVFLDADDLLLPGVLASQLRALREDGRKAMAVCRSHFFETLDARGQPRPTGEWRLFREALDAHLCHFNIAPPHAFMVRREAVEGCGGFDAGLAACEDHDLWLRLAVAGEAPVCNPDGRVAYRRHPGSMSRNLDRQHAHDAILHHRVAEALRRTDFPAARRPEGLLGCLAGCLLTRSRLAARQPGPAEGLGGPIRDMLDRLAGERAAAREASDTAAYFLSRIEATLRLDPEAGDAVRAPLRRAFPEPMPALAALSEPQLRDASQRLTARLVF
ncbi:glycosyltransferase [Solidesulfovibrio sp.]|uniref:glycosyltransferase family 2 protein n=1 Tax=Solidesulfovibrio sp. TaxID=2910990 RepID=UPI002617B271|nr:glycosyltransferase [Solidesulfovibrio sp.]